VTAHVGELLGANRHKRRVESDATDEALWKSASGGDAHAFGVLYERHVQAIYNYLFRRLADESEAEDLTAVVFLEAFRRRRDVVVHEGKLLPWLYGIATNVLYARRRAHWRHRRLLAKLAEDPAVASSPDVERRAEAAEEMRSVLARMAALSRDQRDVVALCIWSGLSYEEAATALGISVGTVRSRLSRARSALGTVDGAPRRAKPAEVRR
jgi:RNA polymerase sigma factor (sigma-70 family)